jgi:hypothetical protein
MIKESIIRISTFRSKTTSGELAKTYVVVYNTGVIVIAKRFLTNKQVDGFIVVKKFKDMYLLQSSMSFKLQSFNTIVEIVNQVKPQIKDKEITL